MVYPPLGPFFVCDMSFFRSGFCFSISSASLPQSSFSFPVDSSQPLSGSNRTHCELLCFAYYSLFPRGSFLWPSSSRYIPVLVTEQVPHLPFLPLPTPLMSKSFSQLPPQLLPEEHLLAFFSVLTPSPQCLVITSKAAAYCPPVHGRPQAIL